ncbi:MAG TPA: hypothetical protein VLY85_01995 [Thermoplasmata archaeon]|nr:hypothetical protein [Thermoplasmata archaeon]
MPAAVLLRTGGRVYLVGTDARTAVPIALDPNGPGPDRPNPAAAQRIVELVSGGDVALAEPGLSRYLEGLGLRPRPAELAELRRARAAVPRGPFSADREALLGAARRRLAETLASPEETLLALAREEERFERVRNRETGAAESWIAADEGTLREHERDWAALRSEIGRHHDHLLERLERAAESVAPNLSAVVGPRVAARLLAAAGGIAPLGRMSASRLQLLGSRRRTGGLRGPKYGVLVRAVRAARVPPIREGAYARSLAALAVLAARADATTRRRIDGPLVARRDRRIRQLCERERR